MPCNVIIRTEKFSKVKHAFIFHQNLFKPFLNDAKLLKVYEWFRAWSYDTWLWRDTFFWNHSSWCEATVRKLKVGGKGKVIREGRWSTAHSQPQPISLFRHGTPGHYSTNFEENVDGTVEHFDVYGEVLPKLSSVESCSSHFCWWIHPGANDVLTSLLDAEQPDCTAASIG